MFETRRGAAIPTSCPPFLPPTRRSAAAAPLARRASALAVFAALAALAAPAPLTARAAGGAGGGGGGGSGGFPRGDGFTREAPRGDAVRRTRFTYVAHVDAIPEGSHRLELWIPIPRSEAHQKVGTPRFEAPEPPSVDVEPAHGNRIAHWLLEGESLHPFTVTMTVDVERWEASAGIRGRGEEEEDAQKDPAGAAAGSPAGQPPRAHSPGAPPPEIRRYLAPSRFVLVGDEVREVVEDAVGDASSTLDVARAAFDYVFDHMTYAKEGRGWGRGSTAWACRAGYGNCTDFHSLFLSIVRTRGIPARFEIGFPLPGPEVHQAAISGYHCWAQFLGPARTWIPADISEARRHPGRRESYWAHLPPDRIHLTTGRDLVLTPPQQGAPLNFFVDPYAEADGRPIEVEGEYSFVDREPEGGKPTHPAPSDSGSQERTRPARGM